MEPRLKSIYKSEILPQLKDSLGVKNVMQVPRLEKIVINMGLGLDANDNKVLKTIETDLANIAGQKPVVTKSKKAISNFKTRAKIPLGLKVTLRKNNMYFFLDRLINIALPRIKDFRGLNPKSFDDNANYSFGVKEHVIFPEVNFDKVDKVRGMDITVVTSTTDKNQAKALLDKFNFPFVKKGAN
ncbi:50S ribosomal protein L5 [Candidatus Pelagibacter sp. HIMB1517]|jgi:large subunit ribosomal protein L5|uniref:50S ribosomal protein L5 n=1 Tax=Candidatus Pelagibacter sp. HIMB1517 TaxID=3413341 RepID=UPI0025696157|nr:50S ribosomal protein L5 [Pelagibacteraceae bacterium]MCI5079304.1 50S ribosomal protein L5 [Pelagibacteraceae bacterium]